MKYVVSATIILALLLCVGCSGGGNNPVTPKDNQAQMPVGSVDSLPIIAPTISEDGSFNALGLMGAYELSIDPKNQTAEIVSKRLPSIGESWIVSGIGFFTVAPCSNCLRIKKVSLTADGNLQIGFNIKHPFLPGNVTLPPSARNRLDLDIFDLACINVPMGVEPTPWSLTNASLYTNFVANADGYTKELSSLISDDAAFPFNLVIDDSLGTTSTFNKFSMGAEKNFNVIYSANSLTNFSLYLTMGYGSSAKKPQRLTPTYFNPEFNRKNAWKVVVTPPQGTDPPELGNTWDDVDSATPYNVTVNVYDWQQGVTTIANPPVNTGDIAFASNVASVSVEIPGMNTALQSVTTAASGTGKPNDPLIFTVPIVNQNLLSSGEYVGLVKVTDSRLPDGLPPTGTIDYLIDAPDGVTLTNYQIPEFATYQIFVATVVNAVVPPTCVIETTPDPPTVGQGEIISFDGASSNCLIPITTYEWDMDYDGVTFDVDYTGVSTTFSSCTPQARTVALRVTNTIPLASICTVDMTINVDNGPIDGWHTDASILPGVQAFTLSTSFREIRSYGTDLYVAVTTVTTPYMSYFIRSENRGQTWTAPVLIHVLGQTGAYQAYTGPNLWVDKNNGYIYCAYHSNATVGLMDVWVTRSTDKGNTWANPVIVNTDPGNVSSEAYANISIDDSVNPARLYVAYQSNANAADINILVARQTADLWNSPWTSVQIDDSSLAANQGIVYVNPLDHSVNVVWTDPFNPAVPNGTARVYFDRSTDGGVTWGTDVMVYQHTGTGTLYGPYEPNIAINPTTGIPGVNWRELDTLQQIRHRFSKATDATGATWNTSVIVGQVAYSGNAGWGGSIDVSPDGHWVLAFKQTFSTLYKCMFSQSQDDGATWSAALQIDDANMVWNPNLCFDDCKNVHVIWADRRTGTYALAYDWGS